MICRKCKREIEDGAQFCLYCGENQTNEDRLKDNVGNFPKYNGSLISKEVSKTSKPFYKKISFWLIVISVIIVVVTMFGEGSEITELEDTGKNGAVDIEDIESFKDSCIYISYDELARNPEMYKGDNCVFTGKIAQVIESDDQSQYLINVTSDDFIWDDPIFVVYDSSYMDMRFLEDDEITFYGKSTGLITYETVLGNQRTIPSMYVYYMELF